MYNIEFSVFLLLEYFTLSLLLLEKHRKIYLKTARMEKKII